MTLYVTTTPSVHIRTTQERRLGISRGRSLGCIKPLHIKTEMAIPQQCSTSCKNTVCKML